MNSLSKEQLAELTERINARLLEFGDKMFDELTLGVVRLVHDVIVEWWSDAPSYLEPVTLSPQATATLGPEHVVVNPVKPSVLTKAKGNYLPTLDELLAEIKRQAMGGVMPTMATFDESRPGNWATAQAQLLRLKVSWTTLREMANLKANPRTKDLP